MNELYEANRRELFSRMEKAEYLKYTLNSLLYWDKITYMPPGGIEYRSRVMGFMGEELHRLMGEPRLTGLITYFQQNSGADPVADAAVKRLWRSASYVEKIPQAEYIDYIRLVANAEQVWARAKAENDFPAVLPYLERLMVYYRKFAEYWGYEEHPMDAWLSYFEEGLDSRKLDLLISRVKPELLSLLSQIRDAEKAAGPLEQGGTAQRIDAGSEKTGTGPVPVPTPENKGAAVAGPAELGSVFSSFPPVERELQMKLTRRLMDDAGFSFDTGRVDEGSHATILASSPMDVRLVTSLQENDLRSCIFNAMYLAGKGLYEQGIDRGLLGTMLAEVSSFALAEAVGRLYENGIGRSKAFWEYLTPILEETIPGLSGREDCACDRLFRDVNRVNLTPVRLSADELTYMVHIIIRYELERELMDGTLSLRELPAAWNKKHRDYLGIEPRDDSEGVLQDIHWFAGYFGYFASYLIAGLTSAQFESCIRRDTPGYEEACAGERFRMTNSWLAERVFLHGALYAPEELVTRACGEPLNPEYYIGYLKQRFSEAYGLR